MDSKRTYKQVRQYVLHYYAAGNEIYPTVEAAMEGLGFEF